MKPKAIFMPHANIQYSQLVPQKRKWVIENCYEKLFDLIDKGDYRIAFEASGFTIEEIAAAAPGCLDQLKQLVREGKIEPVASPYIHMMLSNVPGTVGLHSLKHALDIWEKYVGVRPKVGWNPECGWADYVLELYREAGFETLIMDADSLLLSQKEIKEAAGLQFDVRGHSNKNQLFLIEQYIKDKPEYLRYLTNPSMAENGLKLICRSDCMANPMLWYLMGATEGMRDKPVEEDEIRSMLRKWKERIADTGSFIMPYAEDAEYIGSTAYFYVKQKNEARFFEYEPGSVTRFQRLLDIAVQTGYELSVPGDVTADAKAFPNSLAANIENGVAWHGGTAKAWANTVYSRIMDPVCLSLLNGVEAVARRLGQGMDSLEGELNRAMLELAGAWVSDSRWPPEPTSPGRFNVRESLDHMYRANAAIAAAMSAGGIERRRGLYSPELMETQIREIDDTLMRMKYFGEEAEHACR